ncbi:MAG: RlmE family RNA methyltransferase [Treponema sp.]|nr:RlmE family RNA methyltransferase [Treponema sp.]MCL2250881.1 RlmE family RNA methyltransferase [Treponema sp.]
MADYKKPDHWQQKARKEGYPARSVYKLKEIDEKLGLFKTSGQMLRILDIGAAPGSWSLYVLRKIPSNSFLAAVDLSPLSREFDKGLFDNGNFFFVQGDVTAQDVGEALLSKGPFSVIISDAAPNTTGNHTVDSARSLGLAETAVSFAETALVSGGNLVVKIFQGSGTDTLLKHMKTIFKTAKSFKPQACRGESVETYFIGLSKL